MINVVAEKEFGRGKRMSLKSLSFQHLDWDDDSGTGEVDLYVV